MVGKIVEPAADYLSRVVFGECAGQMSRLKAARVLSPLHALAVGVVDADVDALVEHYRFFTLGKYRNLPAAMKNEIPAYLAACKEIKPFAQRVDSDGKDTFDIGQWWLAKETCLPAWDEALCAVSCSAPNSAPPERAFSILNDSSG